MSRKDFYDCVQGHTANGTLTKAEARRVIEETDRLYAKYLSANGDATASRQAANQLGKIMAENIKKKKRNLVAQADAIADNWDSIKADYDAEVEAFNQLSKFGQTFSIKPKMNRAVRKQLEMVYTRQESLIKTFSDPMAEFVAAHRAKWAGLSKINKEELEDIFRVAGGETVDNPAATRLGKQLRKALDLMHRSYEEAGGIIGKLENWLPQIHDRKLIEAAASPQEWIDNIKDKLDYDKIINPETGVAYMSNKQYDEVGLTPDMQKTLENVYETLSTGGANKIAEKAEAGAIRRGLGGSMASRREHSRFLHFKSVDDYLSYNNMYGAGSEGLFDVVMNHVQSMARDVGAMQVMGPNPAATFSNIEMHFSGVKGESMGKWTSGMFDVLTGKHLSTGDEGNAYKLSVALQNNMRASYLGSAAISALSDQAFLAVAAKMNGMSATNVIKTYLGAGDVGNKAYMQMLNNTGYISEIASGQSVSRWFDGDPMLRSGRGALDKTVNITGGLANAVMHGSGLIAMTQRAKNVITMELHGAVAAHKATKWSDLPVEFRRSAQENGITKADWNVIRKAETLDIEQAKFIRPEDVAKLDAKVALKLEDWTQQMRHLVTNEPTLRTKAITTGARFGPAAPGSMNRWVWSNLFMFKSFPISVVNNFLLPAYQKGVTQGKWHELTAIVGSSMLMGAMALQTKDIVKGRTPRSWDDPKFWSAAFVQGGGAGIFGDFLFADQNRFGQSPLVNFLGPTFGFAEQLRKATIAPIWAAAIDDATSSSEAWGQFTKRSNDLLQRNIPGGSLWYARLALDRMLLDNIDRFADPNYDENVRRHYRQLRKDFDQEYWWGPK